MRTFTVEGQNWRGDFEVDDSVFDNYEDMAFEAMTQSVQALFLLPLSGDNDNLPVWHSSCQHVDMSELKRWGEAHPTRAHEDELMYDWITLAWEKGYENDAEKIIGAFTEYILRNAGEHEWAEEVRAAWEKDRRTR
jgi:hypothetical protein